MGNGKWGTGVMGYSFVRDHEDHKAHKENKSIFG